MAIIQAAATNSTAVGVNSATTITQTTKGIANCPRQSVSCQQILSYIRQHNPPIRIGWFKPVDSNANKSAVVTMMIAVPVSLGVGALNTRQSNI
ncbi:hypothetical protein O9929_13705 [Vibrio lentus]|nr:hypothetical protein [Vibrio lentus]